MDPGIERHDEPDHRAAGRQGIQDVPGVPEAALTGGGPVVRLAGPADAEAVAALLLEFNGEGLSPGDLARRMAEARGLETAFLGEWAGRPAALLILRTVPTLSGADDWTEVTEMYVRPAFRRLGIGRLLMVAALDHARRAGSREVHLLVDPHNTVAQAFYAALGFRLDSWEMVRDLTAGSSG